MSHALCEQGKSLLSEGKSGEARDVYLGAIARNGDNARAWNGLGVSYDLLGKRESAREAYLRALDLNSDDMTVANNLAHLYIEDGEPQEAVALLEPYVQNQKAPLTMMQNLARALKLTEAKKAPEESKEAPTPAHLVLGSYPTQGMAQGALAKLKDKADDVDSLSFDVVPVVKKRGGTPIFEVRASGDDLQNACENLKSQGFSCLLPQ